MLLVLVLFMIMFSSDVEGRKVGRLEGRKDLVVGVEERKMKE